MSAKHGDHRYEQLVEMVTLLGSAADQQLKWLIAMGADPAELVAQYDDAASTWLPGLLQDLTIDAVRRLDRLGMELESLKTDSEPQRFATPDDGLRAPTLGNG